MKKVIIATHEYSGIYKNIKHVLEKNGYEVFSIIFTHYPEVKKNKLLNFFTKKTNENSSNNVFILRNKNEKQLLNKLEEYPSNYFDISFFIRADFYSLDILSKITSISKYNFSYHWDGLDRFPEIISRIHYFDDFYVYQENDIQKYKDEFNNISLTNSFYFDPEIETPIYSESTDILFIGACKKSRMDDILNCYNSLKKLNLNTSIHLLYEDDDLMKLYQNTGITFFKKPIDYQETLSMVKSCKVILDILIKENFDHSGLSLRFFESIKFEKKIITNNTSILKYDFYKPENIFIIGQDDFSMLQAFVNQPYAKLPDSLIEKYSFIKWFESKTNK